LGFSGYSSAFFGHIIRVFRVGIPGYPDVSFLQLFAGYFVISIVVWVLKGFLGFGAPGGSSYRVGKPKKSQKGGSANG